MILKTESINQKYMKKLEKKVAIITGGAGSIGKITARLFLDEGAKVMLVDLKEDELKKIQTELKSEHMKICMADVTKSSDVQHYVDETVKQFGKIEVLYIHLVWQRLKSDLFLSFSAGPNYYKIVLVNDCILVNLV